MRIEITPTRMWKIHPGGYLAGHHDEVCSKLNVSPHVFDLTLNYKKEYVQSKTVRILKRETKLSETELLIQLMK